jgi:hypothetical protein
MSWASMADRMIGVAVRTFSHANDARESLVSYIPKSGQPYDVLAVFDRAHIAIDPNTGAPINSTNPVLGVQRSQFAAEPKKGDMVDIVFDGATHRFIVQQYQPDGVAGGLLELIRK